MVKREMFWLKCCPRCNGDLYEGADRYGDYLACLQCGGYLTEAEEVVLRYVLGQQMPTFRGKQSVITPAEFSR